MNKDSILAGFGTLRIFCVLALLRSPFAPFGARSGYITANIWLGARFVPPLNCELAKV